MEKTRTNGKHLLDLFLRLVGNIVEQYTEEVMECDLSPEDVNFNHMKFFEVLDIKSKMFKSCIFMLNIIFFRLGRYLAEYSLPSMTVYAYKVYRVLPKPIYFRTILSKRK